MRRKWNIKSCKDRNNKQKNKLSKFTVSDSKKLRSKDRRPVDY